MTDRVEVKTKAAAEKALKAGKPMSKRAKRRLRGKGKSK